MNRYQDPRFWLRRYHQRRLQRVARTLAPLLKGHGLFLDCGAGTGEYLALAQNRGWLTLGLDISRSDLEQARQRAQVATLLLADVCHLPLRDSSSDVVLCSEVLEHVPGWEKAVDELYRVTGRVLVVTMPCQGRFRGAIARFLAPGVARSHQEAGHHHVHPFSKLKQRFQRPGWLVKGKTCYIFAEPLASHPIPRLFSPLVRLAEALIDLAFPTGGNHAIFICQREP